MSPPVRPPIPLAMAGGRPQPGNRMGREEPVAGDAPAALAAVAAVAVENAPRVFDFTFDSAVRPGTIAPPTTPAASEDGGPVASAAAAVAVAAVAAVDPSAPGRRRLVAPPAAGLGGGGGGGASAPRWLPASPVPGTGGLWGQAYLVGQGNLHWETSPRMETWLERLQALSLEREEEEAAARGGEEGEATAHHVEDRARTGDKRSAPTDNDEDDDGGGDAPDQPAPKRSRVGAAIQRTLSRVSRRRAGTTSAAPAPSTSAFSSSAAAGNLTASNIAARDAGASSPVPRPFSPSPFGLLSRVGSSVATAGAPSSLVASRNIKICLVGDVGAGKTALFNRLVDNSFVSTSPSLVPNFKTVRVRTSGDNIVNVELWDFPGVVAGENGGPLLTTFFHAAIICFGLENKDNLASLSQVWKPKLNASLHDQHVFVLGLKRDLRPAFPTLALSFLPTAEPATSEMGRQAATAINASGYGECSALTNDNVQAAWEGIINHVVAGLEEHERTIRGERRRDRMREFVAEMIQRLGRLRRRHR
ncbi:hypothetical protein NEMBOFW57_010063 [Staphylotrichum longicolle]|uniref:Uncharacterized protein n=1 Tax=Staphylotrichum longicolle TaxID=669026 RepID=A0AAD4HVZ5_9PEZI|nr:hypothetical protein NEMBOFW57_010063 [Staphylotrichum longicolle]